MSCRHWFLMVILACPPVALALEADSIQTSFSARQGRWSKPPDAFFIGIPADFDMELDLERNRGRVFMLRVDLDGDGAPEYFVQNHSTCGNGGCPYAIFGGRTRRFIGRLFGYRIWVLRERTGGMAVIESIGHLSAQSAMIVRYQFDGSRYKDVSAVEIHGTAVDDVNRVLDIAPRVGVDGRVPPAKAR